MSWKDTLRKMPMPLDTRDNRDEEYKQAIIDYEKSVIEPKLTEYVRSKPAAENKSITIGFNAKSPTDKVGKTSEGDLYYTIGTDAYRKLGNNKNVILNIIGIVYREEGYTTDGTRFNGDLSIQINQPNKEQ